MRVVSGKHTGMKGELVVIDEICNEGYVQIPGTQFTEISPMSTIRKL